MASLVSIGQAVGHVEGPAKVTGHTLYSADVILPGMAWAKCLRSSFPHARIKSINTAPARALAGVHAVVTGADLPDVRIGRFYLDIPLLARDKVRFVGEKVAAVVADTPEIAEAALRLIEVEYEELPAVFDALEAMKPGAPILHDSAPAHPKPPAGHEEVHISPPIPNVLSQVFYRHGDIKAGFAQAARIFEHVFYVPPVHQGYIEPHACAVGIRPDGKIDVWLSNKMPFVARHQLAVAFDVPDERIRVNAVSIGGDFGGKGSLMDTALCYYLASRSHRPVKMVMNYTEELMAGNPRHTGHFIFRTGVDSAGRITARYARTLFNCGAYGSFIPAHTLHGAHHAGGSYRIPNIEIESLRVYTNTVPRGHMRSPGAPQTIFAVETHMDMIAAELGMNPMDFRRLNVLSEGDVAPLGERWRHVAGKETLEAAAKAAGWGTPKGKNVGRGVAMYDRPPGANGQSTATVTVDAKGRVTLLTGAPDTGTGSYTVLGQLVAEELCVPLSQVSVVHGSTDEASWEQGPGGSRFTHTGGKAAYEACQKVRQALLELAGEHLGCTAAQVSLKAAQFSTPEGKSVSLAGLMEWAAAKGKAPVSGAGVYNPAPVDVTAFAAQIAEVEVDPETGQVTLRKLVTAHDVGTIINPLTHQGQIEGGAVQGIGQALIEHLVVRDGQVTNVHLGDYKLPTAKDIPELQTVLVPTDSGLAPHQGKAIGEHSNVSTPAAIANAVYDAVGVRLMDLPITAEKVYAGLRAKESHQ
ncbi:MAG TPA: xanthine dehydrogenase family protein molybdopterin-binding subunit [Candidatus Binataceae bacterium]|nr:xanthine dehydrogenase family protein molybdopterin-binding subunit [Candidatus Binataceae bacterium]